MPFDSKIKIGILRGGNGRNYKSSIDKGGSAISHIIENLSHKYKHVDIFVDKEDVWHMMGLPILPTDLPHKVDFILDMSSHPKLSSILDNLSVPYLGHGSFLKLLGNDRESLAKHVKNLNIKIPKSILMPSYQPDFDGELSTYATRKAREVWSKFPAPWIIKSFGEESTMGIHLAKTFPELVRAIEDGVRHRVSILVEEFIVGKVGAMHSLEGFRDEDIYVLPPQNLTAKEKDFVIDLTKKIHKHLGGKHYLKTDFILHPKLGFFIVGLDTIPDMREGSHFDEACKRIGAEMHHIIEHFIRRKLES